MSAPPMTKDPKRLAALEAIARTIREATATMQIVERNPRQLLRADRCVPAMAFSCAALMALVEIAVVAEPDSEIWTIIESIEARLAGLLHGKPRAN